MILAADGLGFLLLLVGWVYCLFDAITTPEQAVRNLPKLLWVILVATLFDIGALLWLVAGRPRRADRSAGPGVRHPSGRAGIGSRAGERRTSPGPDDDPAFLRSLDLDRRERDLRRREQDLHRREDGGAGGSGN